MRRSSETRARSAPCWTAEAPIATPGTPDRPDDAHECRTASPKSMKRTPAHHEAARGQLRPRQRALQVPFIVLHQTSAARHPGEYPLDDPAAVQNRELFDVDDKVMLAPLDLFARIVAGRAAALRPLHRLSVGRSRAGRSRGRAQGASCQFASEGTTHVQYPHEYPIAAPHMEIVLNQRKGRKTRRNQPSLASGVEHSLDRVRYLPKGGLAGASSLCRRQKARFDQCPFLIRQIALKSSPRAHILCLGGLVPGHVRYPCLGCQMTKDTTSWWGHTILGQARIHE